MMRFSFSNVVKATSAVASAYTEAKYGIVTPKCRQALNTLFPPEMDMVANAKSSDSPANEDVEESAYVFIPENSSQAMTYDILLNDPPLDFEIDSAIATIAARPTAIEKLVGRKLTPDENSALIDGVRGLLQEPNLLADAMQKMSSHKAKKLSKKKMAKGPSCESMNQDGECEIPPRVPHSFHIPEATLAGNVEEDASQLFPSHSCAGTPSCRNGHPSPGWELLSKDFLCTICQDVINTPRVVDATCGHSFCTTCLDIYMDSCRSEDGTEVVYRCPIDKREFTKTIYNRALCDRAYACVQTLVDSDPILVAEWTQKRSNCLITANAQIKSDKAAEAPNEANDDGDSDWNCFLQVALPVVAIAVVAIIAYCRARM